MTDKIGPNDKCPCGSKQKYKRCCRDKVETRKLYERRGFGESISRNGLLIGRPVISTEFKDQRAIAVGNRVYLRPGTETPHDFLMGHFLEIIGRQWVVDECAKPSADQHPIAQWVLYLEHMKASRQNPTDGIHVNGPLRCLLALTNDMYSLKHCLTGVLPNIADRLRHKEQFQGTRYELATAAILDRAGFRLSWTPGSKAKRPECTGVNLQTGERVALEAKSHHRVGVFDVKQSGLTVENGRVKVGDHFREALSQSSENIPLVVFDDLNLPMTPDTKMVERQWFKAVNANLDVAKFHSIYPGTRFGALIITNFSWHLHDPSTTESRAPSEVLAIARGNGKYSLFPDTVKAIRTAAEQYGTMSLPQKWEQNS